MHLNIITGPHWAIIANELRVPKDGGQSQKSQP